MNLGFSTVACQDLDWRTAAQQTVDSGIFSMEVRLHPGNRFFDLSAKQAAEAAAQMRGMGITVTDLGTSVALTGFHQDRIEDAKNCIGLANAVHARGIRVFLGTFITRHSQVLSHDYPGIVQALGQICDCGAQAGVEIWVETHNEFSTGTVLAKLVGDVGRENLRFIWDIIHPLEMGEAPETTLAEIGSRIAHVHIKDGVPQTDPDALLYRYTKLGEGRVPIVPILRLLKERGFDGCLSLEWEKAWRPEIRDIFPELPSLLAHYRAYMAEY